MRSTRVITALDAVVDTTTSNKFYVGGAKRIGILGRRADNSGGTTTFSVKTSMEPEDTVTPTMTTFNLLIDNVTNTNTQNFTRVASKAIANANGDIFLWVDPSALVNWISVTATETSDGTHSALIIVEY
jgi:hypothetical protein